MKKYIHIDLSVFSELNLSGNDAIVFALVAGYCNAGKRFECKLDDVAQQVNMSERGVRYTFDKLVKLGYIVKFRKQISIEYGLSEQLRTEQIAEPRTAKIAEPRTAKIAEQERQKLPNRTAKIAEQNGKNCRTERQKLPNTHYNIKYINKPYIKGENGNFENENPDFFKGENDENCDFFDAANEIWMEHFLATHDGREYTPNFQTHTTALSNIIDNIKANMTHDGYICDTDTFKAYFSQWLRLAWLKCDQFHKERWSVSFVCSQFTHFNTIINSNGNQKYSNGNKQQHGTGNTQQQQRGVSDDYVRKQFERIANSRANRGGATGNPTSDR